MQIFTLRGTQPNAYGAAIDMGEDWVTLEYQPEGDNFTWWMTGFYLDDGARTAKVVVHNACYTASDSVSFTVANVNPTISATGGGAIDEGDTVEVAVSFEDAYNDHGIVDDIWTVTVDWSDGSSSSYVHSQGGGQTMVSLGMPSPIPFKHTFSHKYLDDNPTATPSDNYTVNITIDDGDGGTDLTTAQVTVNNVDPTVSITSITPIDSVKPADGGVDGRLDETEGFIVKGTVTDPGVQDTHTATLEVDLNFDGDVNDDGETVSVSLTQVSPGSYTFEKTIAAVLDDGPAPGNDTAQDPLPVTISVRDDDTGVGEGQRSRTIFNVAPAFAPAPDDISFQFDDDFNITSASISGGITDPGHKDIHTVVVEWGDGVTQTLLDASASFTVRRTFSPDPYFSGDSLYPVTVHLKDDDTGKETFVVQRVRGECVVTGFAVYNVGSDRRAIDRVEKALGVKYFGDGLMVQTVAEGTGDISRCIFERTVQSSTWRTEFGKKVVTRDDKQPKADGPATTPNNPNGSNLPGAGVRQRGNQWRYDDVDIPSYGIPIQTIPGGKTADYTFKISNKAGQVFVNNKWRFELKVDATGKVTTTPTPSGKAPVPKPAPIPTVKA